MEAKKGKFTHFYWTAPGIQLEEIVDDSIFKNDYFKQRNRSAANLQAFIRNELGWKSESELTYGESKHVEFMTKHDLVDYCDVSEKGHMKWYPKGIVMMQLLTQYARDLAHDWGAFEMMNPMLIRGDQNEIGKLMGEFHERDYKVDGGRGVGFLRYASDPLAFPFMQKVHISHNQMPLRLYEQANCFRNEQDGEVSGLKRMRWFIMSDMHAACANEDQAVTEYMKLTRKFAGLMNDVLAKGRWVLGWEIAQQAFDEYGEQLAQISRELEAPALFKIMPEMSHYYAFKNEFQAITNDGSNVQVSTVQWDVKNGSRFHIGYTNSEGVKVDCPVIIHASSIGSVERALCSILENIAIDQTEGKLPEFPLWLAPTQVRAIPVTGKQLPYAENIARILNRNNIRADIEDRNSTLGKSILNANKEWIPYIAIVGEKETATESISVNDRSDGTKYTLTIDQLMSKIKDRTKGLPYVPLSLPDHLSMRPLFK